MELPSLRLVGDRYLIRNYLGKGSFSTVYRGLDTKTNKSVAIKIEAPAHHNDPRLRHEAELMQSHLQHVKGVPHIKWRGDYQGQYAVVMSLLGQNIEDLLCLCCWHFSVKTVLLLTEQLLTRLQDIHNRGVLHRDIKHDNVTIGARKQSSRIFLIDFGLSATTEESAKSHGHFVGSLCFSSMNAQLGNPQSYRDDLESLAYLLVFFLQGSLPWTQVADLDTRHLNKSVISIKQRLSVQNLCRGLPEVFSQMLLYAKGLQAGEMPDYNALKQKFRETGKRLDISYDKKFDWVQRSPSNCDPTLGLQDAKKKRKESIVPRKLYDSTPKPENPDLEICVSSTMIPETDSTLHILVMDFPFRPRLLKVPDPPITQIERKQRKTVETEGPALTQDLRAVIKALRS